MDSTRDSWARVTKSLVITLATLVITAQPLVGGTREPVAKPGACCNKCECCVSTDSGGAPRPVAPAPRSIVAKDYQLVPVPHALVLTTSFFKASVPLDPCSFRSPAAVPVFIRHCTFLI